MDPADIVEKLQKLDATVFTADRLQSLYKQIGQQEGNGFNSFNSTASKEVCRRKKANFAFKG